VSGTRLVSDCDGKKIFDEKRRKLTASTMSTSITELSISTSIIETSSDSSVKSGASSMTVSTLTISYMAKGATVCWNMTVSGAGAETVTKSS
jgi:hypothetical protein